MHVPHLTPRSTCLSMLDACHLSIDSQADTLKVSLKKAIDYAAYADYRGRLQRTPLKMAQKDCTNTEYSSAAFCLSFSARLESSM